MAAQGAGNSRGNRRSLRGGIQVKTVRRAAAPSAMASGSDSQGASGWMEASTKKRKRASVRYREKAIGVVTRPGENFFADAKMAEQFEQRVLEIYAPTHDLHESVRPLPLRLQAERDGKSFKLPSLGDLCMEVISDHFSSRVLPFLQRDQTQSQANRSHPVESSRRQQKRRVGIFGVAIEDEDDDGDFTPDIFSNEPASRPKSHKAKRDIPPKNNLEMLEYVHELNSYLLTILPVRAKQALQELLEKKSPQHLNWHVLTKYFLTTSSVTASKSFRALCTVEGVGERGITALLRSITFASSKNQLGGHSCSPAASLEKVHLQAFTRLTTRQLLPLFESTVQLQMVNLRGCISIDAAAIKQLVKIAGKTLRIINLNWTGVRVEGVEEVIRGCCNLEVLKVAHVQNINDSTVTAMMERISRAAIEEGFLPLARLRKLKLRGTQVGNLALASILKHGGSKLESLDISHTRFGGDGSIQMLSVLLGFTINESITAARGTNSTLTKLNISGLSIPEEEMKVLPIANLQALKVLDCNQMRTIEQQSGHHDLGIGVKAHLLFWLIDELCQVWSRLQEEEFDSNNEAQRCTTHVTRSEESNSNRTSIVYHYERVSLSNKVIGQLWANDVLQRRRLHSPQIVPVYACKSLDLSGSTLKNFKIDDQDSTTDWLGIQDLNLSGCELAEPVDWEALGATGLLRSIDLSGTKVMEEDVEALCELNPYLVSINLTGCRGVPIVRRRKWFQEKA